jgi:hypothetical protein
MKPKALTIPELALLAGTRAALGAGVGLLVSGLLTRDQRKAAGITLLAIGAISTIPIVANIRSKPDVVTKERKPALVVRHRTAA